MSVIFVCDFLFRRARRLLDRSFNWLLWMDSLWLVRFERSAFSCGITVSANGCIDCVSIGWCLFYFIFVNNYTARKGSLVLFE